jgi:hypothetical protein
MTDAGPPRASSSQSPTTRRWLRALHGAESRWPAFAAAFVVIALQARISSSLRLHPGWLLPGVAGVLLVISIGLYASPGEPGPYARPLAIGSALVLVLANATSFVLLLRDVFLGSALSPLNLLGTGVALWIANVLVFSIVYWELDGGGPEERVEHAGPRDLLFPQQATEEAIRAGLASADWQPSFGDYLYVSLTNGIAFSPTDTMPYTKQAKLAMGAQSVLSFAIAAVLVARAVNIARG